MTAIRVLAATGTELPDAQALVFEYLAATQGEAGRAVPASAPSASVAFADRVSTP